MSAPDTEFLEALAATQHTSRNMLHEIDTSDVTISREALKALSKAARSLLSQLLGEGAARSLTMGQIIKLFASRLYWNESGGELIMCADFEGHTVCLPIPAEHWNVNVSGRMQ